MNGDIQLLFAVLSNDAEETINILKLSQLKHTQRDLNSQYLHFQRNVVNFESFTVNRINER